MAEETRSRYALTGLAPGALVAGYRVESRIGAGGMAMVFRARDEKLGRTVALKILAPALAGDREFRARFARESRAVAAVDHPHIIPVYSAGEANGVLYLAMRFISGGDLRSIVRREGPLSGARAISLLTPIAAALDAAHRVSLMHRDVKPANILIDTRPDRPEHPYLSDFGLAKSGSSTTTALTGTGQWLGTPDYAAPEQISGQPARPQTDQYALACVAYAILTGTHPFGHDDSMAVLWAHMYDPPPSLTVMRPDLPPAVDEVLARALAKDPNHRFTTCCEFARALRGALRLITRPDREVGFGGARFSASYPAGWAPPPAGRGAQTLARRPPAVTPRPAPVYTPEPSASSAVLVEAPPVPPAPVTPAPMTAAPVTAAPAAPAPTAPGRSRHRRPDKQADGGEGGDDRGEGGHGGRRWPVVAGWVASLTLLIDGGLGLWLYNQSQAASAAAPGSGPTVTHTVLVTARPKVVRTIMVPVPGGAPRKVVTTVPAAGPTVTAAAPTVTVTETKTVTRERAGAPGPTVTVTATSTVTATVTVTATPTPTG